MQWYDIMSLTLSIASFVITLTNLILLVTRYFACRICTICERKRLEKKLLKRVCTFKPSCIVAPSRNGVEVAENILRYGKKSIPIYQATVYDRDFWDGSGDEYLFTSKFVIEKPEIPEELADRILIIDDVSITGETLLVLKNYLEKNFPRINVRTCALVADNTGSKNTFVPDTCPKFVDTNTFRFCWRK